MDTHTLRQKLDAIALKTHESTLLTQFEVAVTQEWVGDCYISYTALKQHGIWCIGIPTPQSPMFVTDHYDEALAYIAGLLADEVSPLGELQLA